MIYLTQLIYLHPGEEETFHAFEDVAIPLIAQYGGELLLRVRPTPETVVAVSGEAPYEVHVIRFQSEEDLTRFAKDESRQRFLHLKNASVRASLLVKGALV